MSNNKKIAIFAKTPNLSPVKTRLAKSIGNKSAQKLYNLSLAAVLENVKKCVLEKESRFIAIGEEFGLEENFWDAYRNDFSLLWTGDGDLGERLFNVYSELHGEKKEVCIIGSDSPQITTKNFKSLVDHKLLNDKSVLIGPSSDGGFYFFKSNSLLDKDIWTNVRYSESDTLNQLAKNLSDHGYQIQYGKEEVDIDDYESLTTSVNLINSDSSSTPSQRELAYWFNNIYGKDLPTSL